jgi:hypothetical protein
VGLCLLIFLIVEFFVFFVCCVTAGGLCVV